MTTPTDLPARVEACLRFLPLIRESDSAAFSDLAAPLFADLAAEYKRLRDERATYIDKVRDLELALKLTKDSRERNRAEVLALRERERVLTEALEVLASSIRTEPHMDGTFTVMGLRSPGHAHDALVIARAALSPEPK